MTDSTEKTTNTQHKTSRLLTDERFKGKTPEEILAEFDRQNENK